MMAGSCGKTCALVTAILLLVSLAAAAVLPLGIAASAKWGGKGGSVAETAGQIVTYPQECTRKERSKCG